MDISKRLKELELTDDRLRYTRYFDCDGNPYHCSVMLVGINPSLGLTNGNSFWDYWTDSEGFDHSRWLKEYSEDVRKVYRKDLKPTRRRIEELRNYLTSANLKLLNCNIYSFATKRQSDLRNTEKSTGVFRILLDEIKPKLIILSGKPPKIILPTMGQLNTDKFDEWVVTEIRFKNFKSKVVAVPHLFNMALTYTRGNTRSVEHLAKVVIDSHPKT